MSKVTTLAILTAAALFAQSNQGTITGAISDPAGAVVPTAQIEVRNTDSGVVYRGGTSATGNFVLAVPPGTYEITVTAAGFKKFVEQNVQVITATDTRRDVMLEIGAASEAVTVTETAALLKTESGELSHLVTSKEADDLPVLTITGGGVSFESSLGDIRNPLEIVTLLPGVNFTNDTAMVVNGLPSNSEAIHIEGQEATGNIWKAVQQLSQGASVDAVQEVSVQTSNFAAEYGQVGGGLFNYTMKSGTNQLHGAGYDYFVNEALNAGLPFTDAGTLSPLKEGQHIRNAVRRNDYGFTVGGPIRIPKVYNGENKSFFFFSFEQYRENRTFSNNITTVPTAAYRSGNFGTSGCFNYIAATNTCASTPAVTLNGAPATDPLGQTLGYGEVFDPNTSQIVNGSQVRSPFPNQQIPLTRYDSVASAIQAFFPMPNAAGIINNYVIPTYANYRHTTNYSFKLDHSISPTKKLSWYFSRLLDNSPNSDGFTGVYAAPAPWHGRNITARLNYDQSLRPTLLLHVGVGYIQQYQPTDYPSFDQSTLGLSGYFVTNRFPSIGGAFPGGSLGNANTGGWLANGGGVGPQFISFLWEEKPTFSTSLTWVKGNHSFKYGSDLTVDGYPEHSEWRSNGSFSIQNAETSDPWQNLQPFNYTNPTGFNYASFLLGLPDRLQLSPVTQTKTGNHSIGLYAEDSWKITRKLTLDYGLRYDFQTYLKEEHGRMQDASFTTPNPVVGGLLGAVVYEGYGGGRCNCELSHNDPWAFGPRLGAAYQINTKTVLRAGAGVTYGVVQTPNGLQYGLADYYTYTGNGYGNTPLPLGLEGGNPYPNITWPNFSPGKEPVLTNGLLPPSAPTHFFDPHAVPPRTTQWSIGLQRQMSKDIVVEANYVGNRGVHWPASGLDQMACDCLTDPILAHYGLSRNNPSDMALLTQFIEPNGQINQQAAAHGIYAAYPGMPPNQTVNQQILPVPQWTGGFGVTLGPFLGKTWYDSLQTKVTKRFSHGLLAQASFVWSKATDLGTGAESPTLLTYNPIFEDIFNVGTNKQLNQLTRPLAVIISGTYQTPAFASDSKGMKALSQVVRGWQLGWLLRYQNGAMIESATSTNQLESELGRTGTNFDNYAPGVNRLLVNPNCGCFNPQTTLVLNPAAWANPGTGQWGTSAPFYSNYRWQRQPAESASLGRNFRMGKEGKYNLQVRAEFQNIFNRLFLSAPATGATTTGAVISNNLSTGFANVYSAGYGSIATINGVGAQPRSGQLVGRFTF
ncbi:MAG TPA: TonB-dependent receptor [Bryobacteraceae bacterium]